jgi:hypothetical protein
MEPWIRASDADREQVVDTMHTQVGAGRLTLDEFSERSAAAYRARTVGDLDALTHDLPSPATRAPTRAHPAVMPLLLVLAALLASGVLVLLVGLAGTGCSISSMM